MILPMRVVHALLLYLEDALSILFLPRDFIRWTIITWLYREYPRQSIDLYFEPPKSHRHPSFCCFNICEGYNSCVLFLKKQSMGCLNVWVSAIFFALHPQVGVGGGNGCFDSDVLKYLGRSSVGILNEKHITSISGTHTIYVIHV